MRLLIYLCTAILFFAALPMAAIGQETVLKPLDKIRMTCEEEPSLNRDYSVTSDGLLLVSFIGAVNVAGLTEKQAAKLVADELMKQRILTKATITIHLLTSQNLPIKFSGAVKKYGETAWSEGLRLSDVVKMAQPTPQADLTAVRIEAREGGTTLVDFTKYDGKANVYNPLLKPGDSIVFEPMKSSPTLFVLGAVKKPGAIDFRPGLSVLDAIDLANGFAPEANEESIRLQRLGQAEQKLEFATGSKTILQPGDKLIVDYLSRANTVSIVGGVKNPGSFPFTEDMTLLKLISLAGGLDEGIKPGTITIARREKDRVVNKKVDLKKVQEGFLGDISLQKDDRVEIPRPGRRRQNSLLTIAGVLLGIFLIGG